MTTADTKCPGEIMAYRLAAGEDPQEESLMAECEDCNHEFHVDADFWPEYDLWEYDNVCPQCTGLVQAFYEGYFVSGGSHSEKYSLPWCEPKVAIDQLRDLRQLIQYGDNSLMTLRVAQAAIGGLLAGEEGRVEDMLKMANLEYADGRAVIRWIKAEIRQGWIKK